jgi:hypothetical protein
MNNYRILYGAGMIFLTMLILVSCGKSPSMDTSIMRIEVRALQSDKVCHEDYRILPRYKNKQTYLSFENFGYRGIGRCRGHAIVTQTMDYLAKFDPAAPHPCTDQDERTCYETLYELITSILKGEIRKIGGFSSLYEFSLDPLARRILRIKVASTSHRYDASDAVLESYEHPSMNQNVFHDVLKRLKKGHRPYLVIEGTGRIGAHALLAYKKQLINDMQVICIRDPNVVLENGMPEACQNYLYQQDDHVFYQQLGFEKDEKLWELSLKSDEDQRVELYIKLHYEECLKRS